MKAFVICVLASGILSMCACREDTPLPPGGRQEGWAIKSDLFNTVYVLNEGTMGQNNARIDSLGFESGIYSDDIYTATNPSIAFGLGDVGNDLRLHDGRLYAVITGSHKVEIMDAMTCMSLGKVDISSPRNIAFYKDLAFVTSWVGGNNGSGSVRVLNVNTMTETAHLSTGFEPEGIAVANGKIYVACSGGMRFPDYDNTIWVYDAMTLTLEHKITVAENLHHMMADNNGNIWVNSRGNYTDIPSGLFRIKPDMTVDTLNVPCTGFAIGRDKVYYYAAEWNAETMSNDMTYGTISTANLLHGAPFITDGTETDIMMPYGIAIDDSTGRVFISDSGNYTSSGKLFTYDAKGKLEQTFTTGQLPSIILPVALLKEKH